MEQVVDRASRSAHRSMATDDVWVYLHDPSYARRPNGWKLHISARSCTLIETIRQVLPVLSRHRCDAKFARSLDVMAALNSGADDPAAVGKAITIYPEPDDLVQLASELVRCLHGMEGPSISSDRQVSPDAPVYYRYGPMHPDRFVVGVGGKINSIIVGPDGQTVPGNAGTTYKQPPWVTDPFTQQAPTPPPDGPAQLGGRYTITSGIVRAPVGNVYRATDTVSGDHVVVKQARPFVAEDAQGWDARTRLRNEATALQRLARVGGVPDLVDYFHHGSVEYLVTTDCGVHDMQRTLRRTGPYGWDLDHDWWALARQLLHILDQIHKHGVIVNDLKPSNVVFDRHGNPSLIDFGIAHTPSDSADAASHTSAASDPVTPAGFTPGYSLPSHWRDGAPGPDSDYYALGATLSFLATGLPPVIIDTDWQHNRDQTIAAMDRAVHAHPTYSSGFTSADDAVRIVDALMSPDPDHRIAAAQALRTSNQPMADGGRAQSPPDHYSSAEKRSLQLDHLAGLITQGLGDVITAAMEYTNREPQHAGVSDVSIYSGSSGIGLELLQHLSEPNVATTVNRLAIWTSTAVEPQHLRPGLFDGTMGVRLFLHTAAAHITDPQVALARDTFDDRCHDVDVPPTDPYDQIAGLAGIGTGHLLLADIATHAGQATNADLHLQNAVTAARQLLVEQDHWLPATPSPTFDYGYAHGLAGIATFLSATSQATGDHELTVAAHTATDRLAIGTQERTQLLLRSGTPHSLGWCRGPAGMGTALLRSSNPDQSQHYLQIAEDAAHACIILAPRRENIVQCCGLAGIGEFLIDLATVTGNTEYLNSAHDLMQLILGRSGGTATNPIYPSSVPSKSTAALCTGTTGIVSYLRRLCRNNSSRIAMPATTR
ncbi:serine/threonine protein kinase [Rudaeicoccus suwonensis]|uniref:non-specific serine/threonine protein kinase n=1 Tax=Rudaeicoccus suwonensis TaxID=657409 RepID=A0A561EAF7_9MICO|nr:serine/threonine protein kinase [Rudaeicoccus suwonensis]